MTTSIQSSLSIPRHDRPLFSAGRSTPGPLVEGWIFCGSSTRKGTSDTAHYLIEQSTQNFPTRIGNPFVRDAFHLERLKTASKKASNRQLQQCLIHGIAFHHAGMDAEDRTLVENAFLHQDILASSPASTLPLSSDPQTAGPVHDRHSGHGRQFTSAPRGDQGHSLLLWESRERPGSQWRVAWSASPWV